MNKFLTERYRNVARKSTTSFFNILAGCLATIALSSPPAGALDVSATDRMEIRERVNKGNQLLSRRHFQEAIDEYEAALRLDPDSPIATDNIVLTYNNWGIYLFGLRRYNEAKVKWEEGLRLRPMDPTIKRNLKVLDMHMKRYGIKAEPPVKEKEPKPESTDAPDWEKLKEEAKNNPQIQEPPSSGAKLLGATDDKEAAEPGADVAKFDNTPPPTAVIISKPSSARGTPGGDSKASSYGTYEQSSIPGVKIVGSSKKTKQAPGKSQTSARTAHPSSSSNTNTFQGAGNPNASSSANGGGSKDDISKIINNTGSGSENKNDQQSASSSEDDSNTVEDQLESMEKKVYGKTYRGKPIMKRLEKLEVDTSGKKRTGSIKKRIDRLMETYGL